MDREDLNFWAPIHLTQSLKTLTHASLDGGAENIVDLPAAIALLLNQLIERALGDGARLFLCDSKSQTLRFIAGVGLTPSGMAEETILYGEGLIGHIALTRRPFFVSSLSRARNLESWEFELIGGSYASYYGMPILHHHCLQGVVDLFWRRHQGHSRHKFASIHELVDRFSSVISCAEVLYAALDLPAE